ncbi:Bifunctional homocysteine S-methyltransferase/5,10-methylenetetrahydrofolate reductase [Anaerohalosphaera lusitana]|uniref:Bifunctional homocysteine S-methyltransferase/5,10-methylenetetrahydrofolate reductase n=1 Tax=Anaerohalosphaera lusitana TaxID=1936003 RepID=A0A1U9NIH5_9BACT|nr:bifunctional homocysteine S-methyltransferase/methylenetetrahydrofolate reductase [Anaerohalosphaera lusitana]AQT67534.1 Bifunctional homocysteine S-methyltransferase/5,10-methylenetetrahydrofolate reductase [Anaerohalosphaera lusitana]
MLKEELQNILQQRVMIGDGAMGTMLYQRGVFVNTCFDELNLTKRELIKSVHAEYIEAGCDFVETNTFGANAYKLGKFGLVDSVEAINKAGVEIAKEIAQEHEVLVAGSIGPLGREIVDFGPDSVDEIRGIFAQQAKALADAGADFLMLETFSNPDELAVAVEAAASVCDLAIVAQIAVSELNKTVYGKAIDEAVGQIAEMDAVTAVGLNCAVGPVGMLAGLQAIREVTDKPISIVPNAGMPKEIDGRTMYMSTPEYMSEYAKRFFENGARIIGGCCGTTPAHIREIAKAVKAVDKAMVTEPERRVEVHKKAEAVGQEPVPLMHRSKLGAKLARGQQITCVELTPPRGVDVSKMLEKVELCERYGIDAINIPDGPRASSRLSPLVAAAKIQEHADIEAILHVCCRDRNVIGMQSDMLGAHLLGVRNLLLVTGDPPKLGEYPNATAVFDLDAIALTSVVHNLNRGLDVAGNELKGTLSMTVGVGANPVASEMKREIDRFKAKVDAGAEYAITQPVFDTEMLFAFMEAVKDHKIPIIAGIWPFTSYKNAEFMANEVPGVVVPDALLERMSKAKTREEGKRLGVEIAREMIEAMGHCVDGFAVSAPFGNVKVALAALGKIGIDEIS